MKCLYCGKDVEVKAKEYIIIPLDRPYINLMIHRDGCYSAIQDYGQVKYITENIDRVYELQKEINGKEKRK